MLTDKFLFVHMPRTGGSTHRAYINQLAENGRVKILGDFGERSVRNIAPWLQVKKIGFVRNPWAWYVSRYHWFIFKRWIADNPDPNPDSQMTKGSDEGIYNAASKEDIITFDEHMRRGLDRDQERGIDKFYPEGDSDRLRFAHDWPVDPFFSLRGCFRDMYYDQFGNLLLDFIGRTEDPASHQEAYLQAGVDCSGLDFAKVRWARTTEHKPFQEYYSPDLRDLVYTVDREVIEQFGYTFEDRWRP